MESKIESAQREADEVKVTMLENRTKAEERKENNTDLNQRAENQSACKDMEKAVNPKKKQMIKYLRDNKGLLIIVLISAVIIFAVVVAMLVCQDVHGHPKVDGHPEVHGDSENP